jgi:hypothetical protein
MPPSGGLADKIGNRYEGRIAVWRVLQLLDEQHDSVRVRFEEPGDDKFEWWVQRSDGSRTYTQVKRQQSVDDEWTVGTLVSRGVIPAFGVRLGKEPAARCEFFSALSASHLQQLSDDARMAGSLDEFEAKFAASVAKKKSWDTLCVAWPGVTAEQAWQRLRRVTAGNIDEPTLLETLRAHARALVNACSVREADPGPAQRDRDRDRASGSAARGGHSAAAVQEGLDVGGELGVVLEQEPVRGVGVDLDPGARDQAGEQVGVVRQDHRVAVAVGHEHRHLQVAEPLQLRVIGDPPGADRVVLHLAGRPRGAGCPGPGSWLTCAAALRYPPATWGRRHVAKC